MDIIEDVANQYACLWERTGVDDDGEPEYGEVEEIRVYWADVTENFVGPGGETLVSKSKVLLLRDVKVDDVLWPGREEDLTDPDDPFANPGAFQVRGFHKFPNFDGDEFARVAYL